MNQVHSIPRSPLLV